jgi:hypothetical protein
MADIIATYNEWIGQTEALNNCLTIGDVLAMSGKEISLIAFNNNNVHGLIRDEYYGRHFSAREFFRRSKVKYIRNPGGHDTLVMKDLITRIARYITPFEFQVMYEPLSPGEKHGWCSFKNNKIPKINESGKKMGKLAGKTLNSLPKSILVGFNDGPLIKLDANLPDIFIGDHVDL